MYEAAMAASLVVGLVSIPAASQSIEVSQNLSADLPEISSSESIPKEVVSNTTTESFERKVETAFDSFSTSIESDSVRIALENPSSRLTVDRSPSSTRWELTTSQGTLELTESASRTVERTETPSGTLVRTERQGQVSERFSGSGRATVEQKADDLRELLEQQKEEIDRRRSDMVRQRLPEVEIRANETTASDENGEYVVIVNKGRTEFGLENWVIRNSDPDTYQFGSISISPGEKLYVYNSDADGIDAEHDNAVYDTGVDWDTTGDTASLRNSAGVKIEEVSY